MSISLSSCREFTIAPHKSVAPQEAYPGMKASSIVPILLYVTSHFNGEDCSHLVECIADTCPSLKDSGYILAVACADEWDKDYAPWTAGPESMSGSSMAERPFEGHANETLSFLESVYLPHLKEAYGNRPVYIMGYSLAGLFSLYSAYHSSSFDGVICCSGSLWFPGWMGYAAIHSLPHPCKVYLSLGGKENKTKDPILSTIGKCTKLQEQFLKKDPNTLRVLYEMNPGGHFADSAKRLAKGVKFMVEN